MDVDEAGAVSVSGPDELARKGRMLHERRHVEDLSRLDVGADSHRELGVAFEAFGALHAAQRNG